MTIDIRNGRYRHDVSRWTVGQLRAALGQLPDDTILRVEVAYGPSTFHPDAWGNDQVVVTDAGVDDDGDFATEDFVVRVDYSSDWYTLPSAVGPEPIYEPVLLDPDAEKIRDRRSAFTSESEAQKILDIWRTEGHEARTAVDRVQLYRTAEQWEADRLHHRNREIEGL